MKNFFLLFVCLSIVGCNNNAHTKSDFLHNPELLDTTIKICKQDPAKADRDDNCINAWSAYDTKLFMKGLSSNNCFKSGVDHQCLEEKGYKQP